MRWFFFGSLCDQDVLETVIDRPVPASAWRQARLHGYRRVRVVDELYPALRPHPGGRVDGFVVEGLDRHASNRVCFFEGDEFIPEPRPVELVDGRRIEALTFLPGPALEMTEQAWNFHRWQARHKPVFLDMAREFMAGFGHADWAELDARWRRRQHQVTRECRWGT
ncbi:MAG: gamma-glutamylcyclotransferase family protein [Candidatus Competibacterales bacterium]|nr:gamma-glutamylcyclotransferase family protein [Candidatus Competibacterales bacterium]